MELREYLRILLKRWWLIVPLTLISLTTALLISYAQTPTYESTSTYVAMLDTTQSGSNAPTPDTIIYGMDTLTGRQQIFVTYCEVMTSKAVRNEAFARLSVNTSQVKTSDYKVLCSNLPQTNVLQLTVQGPSPELVKRLNEAVGVVGLVRVNELYNYFRLENLDEVSLAKKPIAPKHLQNGVLGGVLGLALGISLALIIEYLRTPLERMEAMSIRHPQMGVYNERYFQRRLEEETNRAHARLRPISVAMLRLKPDEDFSLLPEPVRNAILRNASLMMQDALRKGDMIAYLRQLSYGILLPETPGDEAQEVLQKLHADLRTRTFEAGGYLASFVANTGVVSSSGGSLGYQASLEKASEALHIAEGEGENTIHLVRATPRPFVSSEDTDFTGVGESGPTNPFAGGDLSSLGGSWQGNAASDVLGSWNGHGKLTDTEAGDHSDGDSDIVPPTVAS